MPSRIRSSRIRSGNFGAFMNKTQGQSCSIHGVDRNSNFQSGTVRVNREYIPSTYDTDVPVSIDFQLHYSIHNARHLSASASASASAGASAGVNAGAEKHHKKPLICIHGGPGIPSDYLKPLANSSAFQDRAVILYDQVGCGASSEPSDVNAYSIAYAVQDLASLIQHLRTNHGLQEYHLLGHSYGGIVAYEYFKTLITNQHQKRDSSDCTRSSELLSITLSSSPFDIGQVDEDSENKIQMLALDKMNTNANADSNTNTNTNSPLSEDDAKSQAQQSFQESFVCRTPSLPLPLQEAYAKRGKVWGADSREIQTYVAASSPSQSSSRGMVVDKENCLSMNVDTSTRTRACSMNMDDTCRSIANDIKISSDMLERNSRRSRVRVPLVLLMRGEFDFVSPTQAIDRWRDLFEFKHNMTSHDSADLNANVDANVDANVNANAHIHISNVMDAGHYGMLDSSSLYYAALNDFLSCSDGEVSDEMPMPQPQ